MNTTDDFDGTVRCRASVHPDCWGGAEISSAYAQEPTLESEHHTIVCDPCYTRLLPFTVTGAGLPEELPAAIDFVQDLFRNITEGTTDGLRAITGELYQAKFDSDVGSHRYRIAVITIDLVHEALTNRIAVNN